MDKKWKNRFSTKRAFVFTLFVVLTCVGGIFLLSKRSQLGNVLPGNVNSIPINIEGNLPEASIENSIEQAKKYGIQIELSDGQAQSQTVSASRLINRWFHLGH